MFVTQRTMAPLCAQSLTKRIGSGLAEPSSSARMRLATSVSIAIGARAVACTVFSKNPSWMDPRGVFHVVDVEVVGSGPCVPPPGGRTNGAGGGDGGGAGGPRDSNGFPWGRGGGGGGSREGIAPFRKSTTRGAVADSVAVGLSGGVGVCRPSRVPSPLSLLPVVLCFFSYTWLI